MIVVLSIQDDSREQRGLNPGIKSPSNTVMLLKNNKIYNNIICTDYNNVVTITGGCERDGNIKGAFLLKNPTGAN